jgi:hypothetical protein
VNVNAAELTHRQVRPTRADRALAIRLRIVSLLGPLTAFAGVVWALAQPYRLTLLHPHGQGFWWLVSEPPLFVVAAGLAFHLLVVPGLRRDLEASERERAQR